MYVLERLLVSLLPTADMMDHVLASNAKLLGQGGSSHLHVLTKLRSSGDAVILLLQNYFVGSHVGHKL